MKVKVELEVEIDNCHDYDNDDWYDDDYDMNDIEEYLRYKIGYKIGSVRSILTKNPLYKDNAELYITNFIVKRNEEDPF